MPQPSGLPRYRTWPEVGCTRPSSVRASVVLPQPDSPTRATISPGRISRSTPSTARARAARRAWPELDVRSRTSSIGPWSAGEADGAGWVAVTAPAPGCAGASSTTGSGGTWRTSSGWPSRTCTHAARRPSPAGHSSTSRVGQASSHRAAGVERAAGRQRRGRAGRRRGRGARGARPGRRWSGRPRPAPGCRGGPGLEHLGRRALLHDPAGVHDRQPVAGRASTDRSWVIIIRARPARAAAPPAGSAPGPGPSRRGRWSARRR